MVVNKTGCKIRKQVSEKDLHNDYMLWMIDTEKFLMKLPEKPIFDLVVTSPPYNIGKEYEKQVPIEEYVAWQERIIDLIYPRLKDTGSICWQVGNYVNNGHIIPLDIELAPIFKKHGMKLRNRIVWKFGHGLHNKNRFSGRYEVVMWYTKSNDYVFNLDPVRVPAKYPGKKSYRGPKSGSFSGNPLGKNPEDIWEIPNVKANHIEKTLHPCQFPVGLIERLILSITNEGDLIFDPFSGVASTGVAAALHNRRFWGTELMESYITIGQQRVEETLRGEIKYRPHDQPLYDHTKSKLSIMPDEWQQGQP